MTNTDLDERYPPSPNPPMPVLDPTALTTAQIQREVATLKEILSARIDNHDKAFGLFNDTLTRVLGEVDKAISCRADIVDQKFVTRDKMLEATVKDYEDRLSYMKERFDRGETLRLEQKGDTAKNLESALTATNTALRDAKRNADSQLDKAETALKDMINQQDATTGAMLHSTQAIVDDLKSRMDRMEATKLGSMETKTDFRLNTGTLISIMLAAIAIVGFFLSIQMR